ncbi:unnamed protein product [Meloidogyne enterolobii]|uniref:Uncharacterized protein n=1 Tax=Meloidogyne enterolobii TaxID=390850 RepID=A0ACB0Y658_MELEN
MENNPNFKEKKREYNRKFFLKKKNKRETIKKENSELKNIQSDNVKENSFVNPQTDNYENKGKEPIVWEDSLKFVERNYISDDVEQGECNKENGENYVEEQNEIVVEDPNKIAENGMNQIDLNIYPYDLNGKPDSNED